MSASTQALVIQHLTEAGDGTGTKSFTGNYSTTPALPLIMPAVSDVIELHRLSIYIEDTGNFDADEFGALSALANGVKVELVTGTTALSELTIGDPPKTNGQLAHLATAWSTLTAQGAGTSSFIAHWCFTETFGQPFRLFGRHKEGLRVTLSDNMAGLANLEFIAYGHRVTDTSRSLNF